MRGKDVSISLYFLAFFKVLKGLVWLLKGLFIKWDCGSHSRPPLKLKKGLEIAF